MALQAMAITVIGPDKPGIISQLSTVVAEHEGNWLESHMANLAGQFAGILEVELPEEQLSAFNESLKALESKGLTLTMTPANQLYTLPAGRTVELSLLGQDHPGIVRDITSVLSSHEVSVQEIFTQTVSASMAGGMLFEANMQLHVPDSVSQDQLQQLLHSLSDSIMVDISIEE